MTWLPLAELLLHPLSNRAVALEPALDHAQLQQRALRLAGALQARGVRSLALHLEDAGDLAIALLGAWRAGVRVLLPGDAQAQSRQRLGAQVDLWLDELDGLDGEALPPAALDLDACRLVLCTSGSSGGASAVVPKLPSFMWRPARPAICAISGAARRRGARPSNFTSLAKATWSTSMLRPMPMASVATR